MEADKENIRHKTTKIPLPLEPLPALPKYLLLENKKKQETIEIVAQRHPLQTLNNQSGNTVGAPGPSRAKVPKKTLQLDTRYVTLRPQSEDLDWEYKVFKDDRNASVISISDDERYLENNDDIEVKYFEEKKQKNCLGESRLAVTPALKSPSLEPRCVRNVKRSLKRPHSRELQGLSPVTKNEKKVEEKVKRRLLFNERLQERLLSPDFLKKSYMVCLTRDYTDDMFEYLLSTECKPLDVPHTSSITRACVINWLMKVNGADGNPAVIQSACWYLDSILGTGHVQLEKLQLVAAACYWIAQKLHGPVLSAMRLVKCASHAFTAEKLLAAEKAVLRRLKFPHQPVVPHDFVNYFSWWCDNVHPGEIEVAATFLCMSGLMVDKALCEEFPSVIAAAAVRNALLLLRKRDLMMRLQMCPLYTAVEKKTTSMSYTCSLLRRAVRTISAPIYEYKAPFEHYGVPPNYIAQRIINAANDLSVLDTRHANKGSCSSLSFRK